MPCSFVAALWPAALRSARKAAPPRAETQQEDNVSKAEELKKRFHNGPRVLGGHVFFTDPAITEQLSYIGYDFIWIDGEHGAMDRQTILSHIVAANAGGAAAFVRVVDNDPAVIKPVLEMGPDAIIIPMVSSAEEAARAIAATRYPPKGIRGFGPRRANRYGTLDDEHYLGAVDASLLKIVQIETAAGVAKIDEIARVDGLDAVILGPYDLSGSVGKLGKLWDPELLDACDTVIAACKKAGMACGISIGPADQSYVDRWIEQGVDFMSCGDDIGFIARGAKTTLGMLREK